MRLSWPCPKHKWKHVGGANAGCSEDCTCSVPVHECEYCAESDYGYNDEATKIKIFCALKHATNDYDIALELGLPID